MLNSAILRALTPKWTRYIPHDPTPKQRAFLCLPHREAFFGGAAGGGKSDALLMAALQYVDIPGYAALIFRKTLTDLKQPGALLDRAHQWLTQFDEVKYNASEHSFYFPTSDPFRPSKVAFGYIGDEGARVRYQGIELQYCAFDELTQHAEQDYLWMHHRLRKNSCKKHKTDAQGRPIYVPGCQECAQQKSLPLRMRSASNPGGGGHNWVKKRFSIGPHMDPVEARRKNIPIKFVGHDPERPFIPSFVEDNPYLDQEGYIAQLNELPELERRQMRSGDWDASVSSRFKPSWFKYYTVRGDHFLLSEEERGPAYRRNQLQRVFVTVDPAGSAKAGPGDFEIYTKVMPSYTVISTWGLTPDFNLLWLDMVRFREEIPDIVYELKANYRKWRPQYYVIESNGLGLGVFQLAQRSGLPVKPGWRHQDKIVNATDAIVRAEQGKVWLPFIAKWRKECEDEIFSWFGHPHQNDDVIDTLADACKDISWEASTEDNSEDFHSPNTEDFPDVAFEPYESLGFQPFGGVQQDFGNVFTNQNFHW